MPKKKTAKKQNSNKKNKGGAPTKYKKSYCDEIIEYFSMPSYSIIKKDNGEPYLDKHGRPCMAPGQFPTIEGFCASIGIVKQTLHDWVDRHEEFMDAYTRAKELQKHSLVVNALNRTFESRFAIFFAVNNTDMADKKVLDAGETLADLFKAELK